MESVRRQLRISGSPALSHIFPSALSFTLQDWTVLRQGMVAGEALHIMADVTEATRPAVYGTAGLQRVSLRAVGFARIFRRATFRAFNYIRKMCNRFEMYRVNAAGIFTQVVALAAWLYVTYKHQVGNAVPRSLTCLIPEYAIALVTKLGLPLPAWHVIERTATANQNFRKEPAQQLTGYRNAAIGIIHIGKFYRVNPV